MNDHYLNDEACGEMDDLLRDFFQSETPKRWPEFRTSVTVPVTRQQSFWREYSVRVVLAACIALMAAGYVTLGGVFSSGRSSNGVENVTSDIASKDKSSKPTNQLPNIGSSFDDTVPIPLNNQPRK